MAGLIVKDRSCQHCGKSPITGYKYCSYECRYAKEGHKERKEQLRAQKEAIRQEIEGVGVKVCSQCNKEKAMGEFALQGKRRGRKPVCKICFIKKDTAAKERFFKWINSGDHKERRNKETQIWKHVNPEKYKAQQAVRRKRILDTMDGTITKKALMTLIEQSHICPYCKQAMDVGEKSIDHIIPLAKGGKHSMTNIVICCLPCNLEKKDVMPEGWAPKEKIINSHLIRINDRPGVFR